MQLDKFDSVCEEHFRKEDIEFFFETKMPDGTINLMPKSRVNLKRNSIPIKVCIFTL